MASKLRLRQYIDLPFHPEGDFDRGGVLPSNGSVFIANTAADTVEIVDGEGLRHLATIAGCPEASAVLTVQEENLILAAARCAGKLLVMDAVNTVVLPDIAVGSRPNGLAWNPRQKHQLMTAIQGQHSIPGWFTRRADDCGGSPSMEAALGGVRLSLLLCPLP